MGHAASPGRGRSPPDVSREAVNGSWLPSRQEGKEKGSHVSKKPFYLPLFARCGVGGGNPLHLVRLI